MQSRIDYYASVVCLSLLVAKYTVDANRILKLLDRLKKARRASCAKPTLLPIKTAVNVLMAKVIAQVRSENKECPYELTSPVAGITGIPLVSSFSTIAMLRNRPFLSAFG